MGYADSQWPPVASEVQRLGDENSRLHSMARGDLRRITALAEENKRLRAQLAAAQPSAPLTSTPTQGSGDPRD